MKYEIAPIGYVHNDRHQRPEEGWADIISYIHVCEEYAPALSGIEEFSHIMVIFWFDRVPKEDRKRPRVHPMGNKRLPEVGVFATHSPVRPNPIGVTVCQLVRREETSLKVKGLDALHMTPVLDLKSFVSRNVPRETQSPGWMDEML